MTTIRSVNKKYVNLLNKTFEKYKDIDILVKEDGQSKDVEKEEKEGKKGISVKLNGTFKYQPVKGGSSNLGDESVKKRGYTVHKLYKNKQFTPDEDKIIIETMKTAENKSAGILELIKALDRNYRSIQFRIEKLETGSGTNTSRPFSLQEDFVIIDNALKSLKQCKSLEETELHNLEDLAKSLNRGGVSVLQRWKSQLQNWLLQHYQKNLNLEIRPMLINVLADNFDSIQKIDWDWVKKIPEVSGYTSYGLKRVFTTKILHLISAKLKIETTEITLKELAEGAKEFRFSKVKKDVSDRQGKIIDYFEKQVEMEDIRFREDGK